MSNVTGESPLSSPLNANGSHRKSIENLETPFPLVNFTPSMLAEDVVVQLFLEALDEVLAPIISVLDCYYAYLDPKLAPLDFVDYMSSWLLVSQMDNWTEDTRRAALSSTISRSRWRGTAKSFEDRLNSLFGIAALVTDSGKVIVNAEFCDPASWEKAALPAVTVTLPADALHTVTIESIQEALVTVLPAHAALEIRSST